MMPLIITDPGRKANPDTKKGQTHPELIASLSRNKAPDPGGSVKRREAGVDPCWCGSLLVQQGPGSVPALRQLPGTSDPVSPCSAHLPQRGPLAVLDRTGLQGWGQHTQLLWAKTGQIS